MKLKLVKNNQLFSFKYLLIIFSSCLLIGIILCAFFNNDSAFWFNENTGFYFYSALIQANAAIISIFGIFYIFKIQTIQNTIGEYYSFLSSMGAAIPQNALNFRVISLQEKQNKINEFAADDSVGKMYKKIFEYEKFIKESKTLVQEPLLILIFATSTQIILLISSHNIHLLGWWQELLCFVIVSALEIFILCELYKRITEIISLSNDD